MPDVGVFSKYIRESANELEKLIKKRGKKKPVTAIVKYKSNPFFTDRRVRRAMAHAANIQLVLKNLTYGLSRQASGIFQPGAWMYNEQVQLLSYDLDKARALLDEAGWKVNESDGARYKEIDDKQVKFEFTLLIPQGSTLGPGFATIFM